MTNFEWFLLIVVVIGVPLVVAVVVTLWTIDQARKRKRQNRADPGVGVKRRAAVPTEEVETRRGARQVRWEPEETSPAPDVPRETSRSTPIREGG